MERETKFIPEEYLKKKQEKAEQSYVEIISYEEIIEQGLLEIAEKLKEKGKTPEEIEQTLQETREKLQAEIARMEAEEEQEGLEAEEQKVSFLRQQRKKIVACLAPIIIAGMLVFGGLKYKEGLEAQEARHYAPYTVLVQKEKGDIRTIIRENPQTGDLLKIDVDSQNEIRQEAWRTKSVIDIDLSKVKIDDSFKKKGVNRIYLQEGEHGGMQVVFVRLDKNREKIIDIYEEGFSRDASASATVTVLYKSYDIKDSDLDGELNERELTLLAGGQLSYIKFVECPYDPNIIEGRMYINGPWVQKIFSKEQYERIRQRIEEREKRELEKTIQEAEIEQERIMQQREQQRKNIMIPWDYNPKNAQDSIQKAKAIIAELGDFCPDVIQNLSSVSPSAYTAHALNTDRQRAEQIADMRREGIEFKNWESELAEKLNRIIKETLPAQWGMHQNVSIIELTSSDNVAQGMNQEGEVLYGGSCGGDGVEAGHLYITEECLKDNQLEGTLIHEGGHFCDFLRFNQLPLGMRIEFIDKIMKRLSAGKFSWEMQDYFNDIQDQFKRSEISEDEMWKRKAEEYFGELCEEYFPDPDSPELTDQEREIMEWYLWRIDSQFNDKQFSPEVREEIKAKWRDKARLRKMILRGELHNHKKGDKNLSFVAPPLGKNWEDLGINFEIT